MSVTAERKQDLLKEFATAQGDTGSPEVQVALLTANINKLLEAVINISLKYLH